MKQPRPQSNRMQVKGAVRNHDRNYVSQVGDTRRQGRAADAPKHAVGGGYESHFLFVDAGGVIEVRLGVIVVGIIGPNHDGARREWFWTCYLPMTGRACQPAETLDKAKAGLTFKIREWYEAARLVPKGASA